MGAINGRRGFVRNLMLLSAGATASTMLGGCAGVGEADGAGPRELVPMRQGIWARSPLPGRIPAVRTVHFEPIRSGEAVSTKALRWQPQGTVLPGSGPQVGGPSQAGG